MKVIEILLVIAICALVALSIQVQQESMCIEKKNQELTDQ